MLLLPSQPRSLGKWGPGVCRPSAKLAPSEAGQPRLGRGCCHPCWPPWVPVGRISCPGGGPGSVHSNLLLYRSLLHSVFTSAARFTETGILRFTCAPEMPFCLLFEKAVPLCFSGSSSTSSHRRAHRILSGLCIVLPALSLIYSLGFYLLVCFCLGSGFPGG